MLAVAVAMTILGSQSALQCPVMGGAANLKGVLTDYKGVRYAYCCGGCDATFSANPEKVLKAVKNKTVGFSLFDPVSKKRIEMKDAQGGFADFNNTRFYFATAEEKAAFAKDAKTFAAIPDKECLVCPVSHKEIKSYDAAAGYADYNGVRYYFCCPNCPSAFASDPAKYANSVQDRVSAPKALKVEKKDGA